MAQKQNILKMCDPFYPFPEATTTDDKGNFSIEEPFEVWTREWIGKYDAMTDSNFEL